MTRRLDGPLAAVSVIAVLVGRLRTIASTFMAVSMGVRASRSRSTPLPQPVPAANYCSGRLSAAGWSMNAPGA